MNEQNLIQNMGKNRGLTSEEARKIGRKGGQVKSIKKKLAARLRELKRKGLTKENEKKLIELLENPEFCDLDIVITLQKLKSICVKPEDYERFLRMFLKFREVRHGSANKAVFNQLNVEGDVNVLAVQELNKGILGVLRGFPDAERAVLSFLEKRKEGGV